MLHRALALATSSGTKTGRMCVMYGDEEGIYGLVGMTDGNRPLGRTMCRWLSRDWINLTQKKGMW
jgi:hypothetical protein